MRLRALWSIAAAVLALGAIGAVVSCGGDSASPRVIQVPADEPTIAEAVEKARPGDIVLVAPGTYHEGVKIYRPGITVRGTDRNTVILDGQHRLANGFLVAANNVAIENLTVHSYTQNGVVFSGIEAATEGKGVDQSVVYGTGDNVLAGYRVSYVTAYNNGLYGIYAFASRDGIIEHTYVSGHPDSGIYIGQCKPCNAVVRNVTAELNAIGYYGTNASGSVYVINSLFRHNRLGIAPNSQKAENLAPQEETVVAGNLVVENADVRAPKISEGFAGGGIAIGGGTRNTVVRNRVENNPVVGIAVLSLNDFPPLNNRIEANVLSGNANDLVYGPTGTNDAAGNCFVGNSFAKSLPPDIETVLACGTTGAIAGVGPFTAGAAPDGPDYRSIPAPPPQTAMPATAMASTGGAGPLDLIVDVAAIAVPAA